MPCSRSHSKAAIVPAFELMCPDLQLWPHVWTSEEPAQEAVVLNGRALETLHIRSFQGNSYSGHGGATQPLHSPDQLDTWEHSSLLWGPVMGDGGGGGGGGMCVYGLLIPATFSLEI